MAYVVGACGFEYDDENYNGTDGLESALKVVETKADADALVRSLTLDVFRGRRNDSVIDFLNIYDWDFGALNPDGEDLAENPEAIDWGRFTDDQIMALLEANDGALFSFLRVVDDTGTR